MRIILVALSLLLLQSTAALATGCEAVLAAMQKGEQLPTRTTFAMTMGVGGPPMPSPPPTISANGTLYTQEKGIWKTEKQRPTDADYWAKQDCQAIGTEIIDGDNTDMVMTSTTIGSGSFVMRYWISKITGLIVKIETTTPMFVLTSVASYRDVVVPDVGAPTQK